jgi:F420-0:gamma-glutamyl ligase-like protein
MFIWTLHDAIFVGLLGLAAILLVLAWLFYWIGRLIGWLKKLARDMIEDVRRANMQDHAKRRG